MKQTNEHDIESDVDLKAMAINAMNGIKLMSPQLNGVVQREKDVLSRMQTLEQNLEIISHNLEKAIESQKNINELFADHFDCLTKRIEKLETLSGVRRNDSWISNILKIFRISKKKN